MPVPPLRVRFDRGTIHYTVSVGNGRFYFSVDKLQSDVHVMDVVRR